MDCLTGLGTPRTAGSRCASTCHPPLSMTRTARSGPAGTASPSADLTATDPLEKEPSMSSSVTVTIGVGGMGQAITRRVGSGARLLLADYDKELLGQAHAALEDDGYDVTAAVVDVSDHTAVAGLAEAAAALGPVTRLIHTAGLSPAKSGAAAILAVDLAGVAYSVEEFGKVIAPGGAG